MSMKIQTDPLSSTYGEEEEVPGCCPARMLDKMSILGSYLKESKEQCKLLDV